MLGLMSIFGVMFAGFLAEGILNPSTTSNADHSGEHEDGVEPSFDDESEPSCDLLDVAIDPSPILEDDLIDGDHPSSAGTDVREIQFVDYNQHDNLTDRPLQDDYSESSDLLDLDRSSNDSDFQHDASADTIVRFGSTDLEGFPSAMSDWVFDEGVRVISANDEDVVSIEATDELKGSIVALEANYTEYEGSEDAGAFQEHTGQNLYFVPEGKEFPEDYSWSETGATLYNTVSGIDNDSDFDGIKLICRIDTGVFGGQISSEGKIEINFDSRVNIAGIQSSLDIEFL